MEFDVLTEKERISLILRSTRFNLMKQAKDVMWALVYDLRDPSVNDLLQLIGKELLPYGDSYRWTNLKFDILTNKYGAAYRQDSKTKHAYFVLQLPVPEKVEFKEDI